jgi:hypothetical protein
MEVALTLLIEEDDIINMDADVGDDDISADNMFENIMKDHRNSIKN